MPLKDVPIEIGLQTYLQYLELILLIFVKDFTAAQVGIDVSLSLLLIPSVASTNLSIAIFSPESVNVPKLTIPEAVIFTAPESRTVS